MKKTGVSASGVFTIKEYIMDDDMHITDLIRQLENGPGKVQEIISYVFEGDDPLQLDARSFSTESFLQLYPQMESYGSGLAFDVVIRTEGQPVTVELTQGQQTVCTNSLDKEIELEDLLGEAPAAAPQAQDGTESTGREDEMSPRQLLDILAVAERLKCNTRHCETSSGRQESVAEHSWRAALMAMLLSGLKEFGSCDMDRVIRMCLIHDLGEAFTGDVPTFEKTAEDEEKELSARSRWIEGFPGAQRREFQNLFAEMEKMETTEAKLYKAIDKIEAVIQHNESDIRTWLPLEYELQKTYGQEEAQFSTWLRALREQVDVQTRDKIESAR